MMSIWEACAGISNIEPIENFAWRIVEDQARSSTRKMVDTTQEHELLEKMLEEHKPQIKYYEDEKAFKGLHYLLSTPFRYPPLRIGSRFGTRAERNLFYAALELKTAMTEKAFHRFSFLLASEGNIGGKIINFTAFKALVNTQKGIDLSKFPFNKFREDISSPVSYKASQTLGNTMRKEGVEAFISYCARSHENGKNLNVFTPNAFGDNKTIEKTYKTFSCYSTKKTVEYYSNLTSKNDAIIFNVENFYVNGQFPFVLD